MTELSSVVLQLGASLARVESPNGAPEEARGAGGGLVAAMGRSAHLALAASLSVGQRLTLVDGPLRVVLTRRRLEALVLVEWEDGSSVADLVRLEAPNPVGAQLAEALHDPTTPMRLSRGGLEVAGDGVDVVIPPIAPGSLGAATFRARHRLRAAYAAAPLAYGVSGPGLVSALARAGLLGFLGTTGLDLDGIRGAMASLASMAAGMAGGLALPQHGEERRQHEEVLSMARLLDLRHVMTWATAPPSAELVRFRASGLTRGPDGRVVARNHLFVAVTGLDAAEAWLRPAPAGMLDMLHARGQLSASEVELARRVPVAGELVAEGHSGGRTERWPLLVLLPCLLRLRDRVARQEGYVAAGSLPHIGAAGELGDPSSVAAAFGLGADFVVTEAINATAVEATTSLRVKQMLAEARVSDCRTAPALDRFETGGRVQVLGRGTRFPQQADQLYELYRRYRSIDEIPEGERRQIERTIFNRPMDELWAELAQELRQRRPVEAQLAADDPRHKMALLFRWYLDNSLRWGVAGTPGRSRDYQIWCGPAVGLFNDWVRGSWLEPLVARGVVTMADALLRGAAAVSRVTLARDLGASLPAGAGLPRPVV